MTIATGLAPFPVLLYHSVRDDPPAAARRYTVGSRNFREHLAAIADSGRVPVTITELALGLRGLCPLPARPVAITIDDGYRDTVPAVCALAERELSSTLFLTTSRIAGPDPVLPPSVVRALLDVESLEIGAHTVSHPYLDVVGTARAAAEIGDSRAALENRLERAVYSFAYPHGAYDAEVRRLVIAAGYRGAAAVKGALSHPRDDPWAIARLTVMANTTTHHIAELLESGGAPIASSKERLRTRGYRYLRRIRRRLPHVPQ